MSLLYTGILVSSLFKFKANDLKQTWINVIIEYIKDMLHFRDLISTIYQEWINKNRAFVYIPDPMALPLEYWL